MLAIERWGEGRFKPLVMVAQMVAVNAAGCYEMLLHMRQRSLLATEPSQRIGIDEWLQLYRKPLQVESVLMHCLCGGDIGGLEEAIQAWPGERQGVHRAIAEVLRDRLNGKPGDVQRAERWLHLYYRLVHLPLMKRMLADEDEAPTELRIWFAQPELVFALSVAIPCWLEFQETPWNLFIQARSGDLRALEKLWRLDPDVDKEDTLRAMCFRLRNRNPEQYRLLQRDALDGRTNKLSLEQVKCRLGGLIMRWADDWDWLCKGEAFFESLLKVVPADQQGGMRKWVKQQRKRQERIATGCRLTAPAIKGLFDAVAQDKVLGLADRDFCQQPNTIYQRLKRNANAWRSLREPYIFRAA